MFKHRHIFSILSSLFTFAHCRRLLATLFTLFFVCFFLLSFFVAITTTLHAESSREQLEKELQGLENQIKALQGTITQTQAQKTSLSKDIILLSQKIEQSKLKIKSHDTTIKRLSLTISEKDRNIKTLDDKIEREKNSLSQIMRKTEYIDTYTVLDFAFQSKGLSSFYSDIDTFSTLKRSLSQSFADIQSTQSDIEGVKADLEYAKDEEQAKKLAQEREKKNVESNQKEKNSLLTITKNQEVEYKKVLVNRQKEAAQIRDRLFALRDISAISFGQAYDYSVSASKSTGVKPALIMAILMQESALGIDVGACYIADKNTGDGVSIKSGVSKPRVMHPTRDIPPFFSILSRIGRTAEKTPVSCWIPIYSKGNPIGWGGAMGPSQFIPSTWVLFEERIKSATGSSIADPWNPAHAITATAMYLADLGASSGTESGERNAACKYYSGRSCATTKEGAGYGNSVMKKMYAMQKDIDTLQNK